MHGRMDGAVQVVLRRRDVVVELAGDELPQRMHDAERGIAFGDAVHQHARRANVHELLEGELLGLHLAPDAVDVLRPPLDRGLDSGGAQFALQLGLQLLDIALAFGAAHLQRGGDVLVFGRLQIAERQVLQFPFHLPDAEPVGERRVDFARLDRELALERRIQRTWRERIFCSCSARRTTTRRTSPITASSILRSASACAGLQAALRRPIGRQAEIAQLIQGAGESRRLPRRSASPRRLAVEQFRLEQRLQHRGDDDVVVGVERADDLGDLERRAARSLGLRRQLECAHGRNAGFAASSSRCGLACWFPWIVRPRLGGFRRLLPVSYTAMQISTDVGIAHGA